MIKNALNADTHWIGVTEVFTCESNIHFLLKSTVFTYVFLIYPYSESRLSGEALLQLELLRYRLLHFFFNASFAQHNNQQLS